MRIDECIRVPIGPETPDSFHACATRIVCWKVVASGPLQQETNSFTVVAVNESIHNSISNKSESFTTSKTFSVNTNARRACTAIDLIFSYTLHCFVAIMISRTKPRPMELIFFEDLLSIAFSVCNCTKGGTLQKAQDLSGSNFVQSNFAQTAGRIVENVTRHWHNIPVTTSFTLDDSLNGSNFARTIKRVGRSMRRLLKASINTDE